MHPVIDHNKCTGAGTCVEVCPVDVFEMKDDKGWVARPEDCIECGQCVDGCPSEAIELVED